MSRLNILTIDQSLSNCGISILSNVEVNDELQQILTLSESIREIFNTGAFSELKKRLKNETELDVLIRAKGKVKTSKKKMDLLSTYITEFSLLHHRLKEKESNLKEIFSTIKTFSLTTNITGSKRLLFYFSELDKIVKEQKIDMVVFEGYSYGSSATRSLFELGELGGVIKLLCEMNCVPSLVVPPTVLKKFFVDNGAANKEQLQQPFLDRATELGCEFLHNCNDDEIDSFIMCDFLMNFDKVELPTILKSKYTAPLN